MRQVFQKIVYFPVLMCIGCLSGCGSVPLDVIRYPEFWSHDGYDSIAVAPVTNQRQPGRFEEETGNGIVQRLVDTGSYRVSDYTYYTRGDGALMHRIAETREVDLVLFTTISDYDVSFTEEVRYEIEEIPVYAMDEEGYQIYDENGEPVIERYETVHTPYPWYLVDAYATIHASVFLSTGGQLYEGSTSDTCHDEGGHPSEIAGPHEMQSCAVRAAMRTAVDLVQPVVRRIRVDEDQLLGIYTLDGEQMKETKKFPSLEDTVYLKIDMPDTANFNTFSIDIVPQDNDEQAAPLTVETFVWNSAMDLVYAYPVRELYEKSGGQKEYTVRFWNQNRVALTKSFELTFD